MQEQSDWEEYDGESPGPSDPRAAQYPAADEAAVLDRYASILEQEIRHGTPKSRSGHEARDLVVQPAVEKHAGQRDFCAGTARQWLEENFSQKTRDDAI